MVRQIELILILAALTAGGGKFARSQDQEVNVSIRYSDMKVADLLEEYARLENIDVYISDEAVLRRKIGEVYVETSGKNQ